MDINIKRLQEPLPIESIDFRIQQINKGGYTTILAYKDARVDINRLNEVCGVLGWKREHTNNNHNCIVSIWDKENKQWVSKEDTGTESFTEKEKGLASDSFKRACFNLGIGISLYDFPSIKVKLNGHEKGFKEWENKDAVKGEFYLYKDKENKERAKQGWGLDIKNWVWYQEYTDGKISYLGAKDNHKKVRFQWGKLRSAQDAKK